MAKGPGHDTRLCRFFSRNPDVDYESIPKDADKSRLGIYLCHVKGKPLITTMKKCRFCRDTKLWYEPRAESPDHSSGRSTPVSG
jgi:hypothetical protein